MSNFQLLILKFLNNFFKDLIDTKIGPWLLGNIVGKGSEHSDLVTNLGILKPILDLVKLSDAFLQVLDWKINPNQKPDRKKLMLKMSMV